MGASLLALAKSIYYKLAKFKDISPKEIRNIKKK